MRGLLRRFVFYTLSLFITTQLLAGFRLHGGVWAYIIAGIMLSLMMLILKPILKFISIPINIITFGFFSFFLNTIILFLLTVFVSTVTVDPFTLPGIAFFGFAIPAIALNKWFAYIACSVVISGVYSILAWITAE